MPVSAANDRTTAEAGVRVVYSPVARALHWLTVLFVTVLLPVGIVMHNRGPERNIWDALTNNLYSGHKLMGFILLWIVVARLAYRLIHGARAPCASDQTSAERTGHPCDLSCRTGVQQRSGAPLPG